MIENPGAEDPNDDASASEFVASVVLPSADFDADLTFLTEELGARLDLITPADAPSLAVLSLDGLRLRLDAETAAGAATLDVATDRAELVGTTRTAPGGTTVTFRRRTPARTLPPLAPRFTVDAESGEDGGVGRAGMRYRDLIPDRWGGRFIASHIRVPGTGPVPDYVHHHDIRFQLIFCRRGAADLVYEDQGEPFRFEAGDCVLQPPHIRHRVLHSYDDLEVVEISSPARHDTLVEHRITLPTGVIDPDRDFGGQRFVHHVAREATYAPWGEGLEARDTGIGTATGGLGRVIVARPAGPGAVVPETTHDDELLLWFVLDGAATLTHEGQERRLGPADSAAVPAGERFGLHDLSDDLELLEVRIGG